MLAPDGSILSGREKGEKGPPGEKVKLENYYNIVNLLIFFYTVLTHIVLICLNCQISQSNCFLLALLSLIV